MCQYRVEHYSAAFQQALSKMSNLVDEADFRNMRYAETLREQDYHYDPRDRQWRFVECYTFDQAVGDA